MLDSRSILQDALRALGDVLTDRRRTYELVAVGGSSLMLLGLLERPTRDLDILALIESGHYVKARPLPEPLLEAVRDVGQALGLGDRWVNADPTDLLDFGLPEGFASRLETRRYGSLTLHLASRLDQVCFKLYAAVDQGPNSKHFQDLQRLSASPEELLVAAKWSLTHDLSERFRSDLIAALKALGTADAEKRL